MTSLDSSIVNIALPSIAHGFGVPVSGSIEWILDGYLVVIAATLLTFGRMAGNARVTIAMLTENMAAAPRPWKQRAAISTASERRRTGPSRS